MIEIEILGSTRLRGEGDEKWTPLRSGGALIAYLVLHAPQAVDRKKCAYDLFPDETYEVSGNRLRVLIARFKKLFGENLSTASAEMRILLDQITVDYFAAREQMQLVEDEVDVEIEFGLLGELLPTLEKELLPEIEESWVRTWQDDWQRDCLRMAKRRMVLCLNKNDWEGTIQATRVGLKHSSADEQLWRGYLKAMHQIGGLDGAMRELTVARNLSETDFADSMYGSLTAYGKELQKEDINVAARWSDAELMNLGRMVARAIEDGPEDAGSFFMSRGATGEFYRDPSSYLPFLRAIVDSESVVGGLEQDLRLKIMDASGLKYDWEEVMRQTDILLSQDIELARLGRVYFGRSFALFQVRDYAGALDAIRKSIAVYEDLGDPVRVVNSRAVEASYRWHGGEYETAIRMYAEAREYLKTQDTPISRGNISIGWANTASVNVVTGDWAKALDSVNNCFDAMGSELNENMFAMFYTLAGVVYVRNKEFVRGIDLLVDGLKRSYRRDSSREMQIGLEWAAGALIELGESGHAIAVLNWVGLWREKVGHTRSVAEQAYADRMLGEGLGREWQAIDPDESAQRVITFVIQQMRSAMLVLRAS